MTVPGSVDVEGDELRLEAPPHPEFISMARLFAGAVARHHRCDEDTVDDLKIAISESVTNAIKAHQLAGVDAPIRVGVRVVDGRLNFEVRDEGGAPAEGSVDVPDATPPGGLFEGSLGLTVIKALLEDCEITHHVQGTVVRFSVKIA